MQAYLIQWPGPQVMLMIVIRQCRLTWSTSDATDSDLGISLSNRGTIITSTNTWPWKIDTRGSFNVDSFSVRTVCWCWYFNFTAFLCSWTQPEQRGRTSYSVKLCLTRQSYPVPQISNSKCKKRSHQLLVLSGYLFALREASSSIPIYPRAKINYHHWHLICPHILSSG